MKWIRDHALGLVIAIAFMVSWFGHSMSGWQAAADHARMHDEKPQSYVQYVQSGDFWATTFENWQSEFLQWGLVIWLSVKLVHKGSAESRDSEDRIEAKIDELLERKEA